MKILCTLILLSAVTLTRAQIEIIENSPKPVGRTERIGWYKNGPQIKAELSMIISKDTVYSLRYAKHKRMGEYNTIRFYGPQTVSTLYNILKLFFAVQNKKNNEYKKEIRLGDTDVLLANSKSSVMFWTAIGHFYMTENQVDKLFGY